LQCCSCFCITLTETNNGDDIQKKSRIVSNQPQSLIDKKRLSKL